jgi:small subunit ribosomal protein S4
MGDPSKTRKKYSRPKHPWKKDRIEEEGELVKKYAPKNHTEIWKMDAVLENFKHQAKKLSSLKTAQAEKERKQLLNKVISLGLLNEGSDLASILILKLEDIMNRRLQTLVNKKGLGKTMKQARQFITHAHIMVNGKVITSPSYLVLAKEEPNISFKESSELANAEHAERKTLAKPVVPEAKKDDRKKDFRRDFKGKRNSRDRKRQ